ncbi:outer membrane beta-barrel protein [Leptobacterium sp. I13]|uniref:outer membrane beta-barrel protein n=1 Tax=Leptobacterium meishanense TaxID=3128904 RepID=UPI0030EDF81E
MIKKQLFVLFLLIGSIALSQTQRSNNSFGIKAGLNYSSNGNLTVQDITNAGQDIIEGSESKTGYHVGFYGKIKLLSFYLRPELVYTKTKSQYDNINYDVQKIDLPILVGYKIIGPLSVFAGPSFQYILDNDLDIDDIDLSDVESDISLGLNIGALVEIGNLGLDVRYERGFSDNEAAFISQNINNNLAGRVDSRPSQIIFSVSLKL